jgi:hypothetical protein
MGRLTGFVKKAGPVQRQEQVGGYTAADGVSITPILLDGRCTV